MSRRWLLFPVLLAALGVWVAPAAAFTPLWSQPVNGAARLVAGGGATLVWAAQSGAGTALVARTYTSSGQPVGSDPVVLVDGISGLTDWLAAPDGAGQLVLAWKAGGATTVQACTVSGSALFGPTVVSTDAAVAALRGAGASAAPVALEPDGLGGAYVLLLAAPSAATGDSLLTHVSSLGVAALPDPGLAAAKGTAGAVAADDDGHLFALLSGPGRNGVAVQRFAPDLSADWDTPVSAYDPLVEKPPATAQTPFGITAGWGATAAWREGDAVKVQRFSPAGDRLWLSPSGVDAGGADAEMAGDGDGGVFVAATGADGLGVWQVTGRGVALGGSAGSVAPLNLATPHVDAVCSDSAGDLDVAYSDATSGGAAGVARMTCVGAWTTPSLGSPASEFTALAADGAGGAYGLSGGADAHLWRLGEAGATLTFCPRAANAVYGQTVDVSGYLTLDGEPLAGVTVSVTAGTSGGGAATAAAARREGVSGGAARGAAARSVGSAARGATARAVEGAVRPVGIRGFALRAHLAARAAAVPVTAVTDAHGFYQATLKPETNASWTAAVTGPAGQTIVSDPAVVTVAPEVSLKLQERRVASGYVELFSGVVKPAHPGSQITVQRQSGDTWRTVATGTLSGTSKYVVSWPLPLRSATYYFRTVVPADADHGEGASRTARLKVVIK